MPIAKEILNMFEFSRNPKITLSVDNHFDECALSQERSVPTEQPTLSMHRYLLIESHCKPSVALWVHPLSLFRTSRVICMRFSSENNVYMHTFSDELQGFEVHWLPYVQMKKGTC